MCGACNSAAAINQQQRKAVSSSELRWWTVKGKEALADLWQVADERRHVSPWKGTCIFKV